MGKNKRFNKVTIALISIIVILSATFVAYIWVNLDTPTNKYRISAGKYDYSDTPIEKIKLSFLWTKTPTEEMIPLTDVDIYLYDKDMNLLYNKSTDSPETILVLSDYLTNEEYVLLKAEYWAKFEVGGYEIARNWVILNYEPNENTMELEFEWAPKIWSNEPPKISRSWF